MGCDSKIETIVIANRKVVFSGGATLVFIPMSPDELAGITPRLDSVRMSVLTEAASSSLVKVRGVYKTGEDEASLASANPAAVTTYVTGVGAITSSWTGTADSFRRLVQFGVEVANVSGTLYEMAVVTVTLDLRMQS